ncbi:hypothetical protein GQ600_1546 [Phytophthora cactorum]|nr:hypothetical protein GQ600_1546 [Phytophthora cactorum]
MQLKTAEIFAAVKTSSAHCGPVGSGGTLHSSVCSTCFSTLHGIVVTVSTIFCIANVAAGRTMGSDDLCCFGSEGTVSCCSLFNWKRPTSVADLDKSLELQK